ncbi:MAG: PTS sugar transporter subunit IIB [Thomasclavelia sp.]|jgi:PTS system cellobiose-specific IIB component|nr:PTS sugar transporter subunit IIB [Thomasclavelia sp.]
MKTIMLVCGAGMSTSLLVTKMQKAATALGEEANIFALPVTDGIKRLKEVDCVLLGPQVRYNLKGFKDEIEKQGLTLPCEVIDMRDYGVMNGEKVYDFAKKLMGE